MLLPKRVKYRRVQRGRRTGIATRGNKVSNGEYGLQALEAAWIKSNQIEAARIAMTRYTKRGGKVWIKIFPDKPVTEKPAETRMGSAVLENFDLTHAETDYLLSYPDENHFDAEQESRYLEKKATSPNEIELIAFVDGKVAGTAGIDAIGAQYKVAHRAEFGIGILKEYWGLGIQICTHIFCRNCAYYTC